MKIESRLPNVGTTIFTVMSNLAAEHGAVNLGQGFPDYEMSPRLISLVNKAMKKGLNQYAPMAGWGPLREAIADKIGHLYNVPVDPEKEITVTPGGTYAIYSALTTILQPGDEVIVFEPAYDSYIPNIEINGAKAITIDLLYPDYRVDWQAVKNVIGPRTRAIILNSPHNPTGSVLKEEDITQLQILVRDTDIFIISDEVYEHLIFDGVKHQSMLRYPDLFSRSFVCFSFGKTYHCTGWKLGYCVAPAFLMTEFRRVHQFNAFACNMPLQAGIAKYMADRDAYLSLSGFMQKKRDRFMELMSDTRFELLPSGGSYFICAKYHRISDEPDRDFAVRLTKETGVATIPVSAFYRSGKDDRVIRFCFSKRNKTLEEAAKRLKGV